jgi:hypothetical protein
MFFTYPRFLSCKDLVEPSGRLRVNDVLVGTNLDLVKTELVGSDPLLQTADCYVTLKEVWFQTKRGFHE